ncbi:MAG: Wzz/FepE/Etk N-terminal domain-containing protein [Marinilabiliaceae bacterium]|nr:Wzz/FepE/Etk N-terminal domain-containing protein [Marinilabiliaceae bacterium]
MKENEFNETETTVNENKIIKSDEIDVIDLLKTLWNGRKTIIYTTVVVVFFGIMIAILSPVRWDSKSTFMLQQEESNISNLGGLGALAGMAGINIGNLMGAASGITTDIYPDIVYSYPFLSDLLNSSFYFEKEKDYSPLYDILFADTIPTVGEFMIKYSLRLPWTIKDKMAKKKKRINFANDGDDGSNLIFLDYDLNRVLEDITEMISIAVDKESGLVTVKTIIKREPIAAAQITQKMVDLLQQYIIENQTKQVHENLLFIEKLYLEKKSDYEKARKAFFDYQDANRNRIPERTDVYYQELSDAYNLSMGLYQNLAEQYEQAKIAVRKETPVFSIIEPAKVAHEKDSPKRTKIVILSGFLGGFLGIGVLFCKMFFAKFKKEWKS